MTATTLSFLIEQWCAQEGHTPAELARRARLFPGGLSGVLAGRHKLDRLRADRLAAILGLDVEQVLAASQRLVPSSRPRPGPAWRQLVDEAIAQQQQTIRGFADAAGLSRTGVFDVLRGARRLTPLMACCMVENLGIDLRQLLLAAEVPVPTGLCGILVVQRWSKGWSKAELARRSRTSMATIGQIEQGILPQRPAVLLRIAAALGVEVSDSYTLPTPFARALNSRMLQRQMTLTELAIAIKVSRGAAAKWLAGTHPRARTLTAITAVLGDPDQQMHRAWQQHRSVTGLPVRGSLTRPAQDDSGFRVSSFPTPPPESAVHPYASAS
jgi:transcriptional regulator with XRE-family HTH domain/plasmid maintenance system antidote protein VapI